MSISDFEAIKQINIYSVEYWRARDLMPLLGYGKKWQNFAAIIKKAMVACSETGNIIDQHFTDASKTSPMPNGGEKRIKEYILSRFACYLIAQNGDPRKSEIAAAQVYFAVSTRAYELHMLREKQEKRLMMRLKVSESYKQLADAAYQSGVNSETFGIFVDAGYLGLHHHTVEELKERKSIPNHEDYLDNITREELSAIDFKNVQTEARLTRDPVKRLDEASQAHYFIGDQVRKAIEAMQGPMPETLPPAASIRKMVEERRKASKKRKLKAESQSQDKLFQD
jgi:DNA-damage-inducible protein D